MGIGFKFGKQIMFATLLSTFLFGCGSESEPIKLKNEGMVKLIVNFAEGGAVTVSPTNVTCVESCILDLKEDLGVTLTALPNEGYSFEGWYGDCTDLEACTFKMSEERTVLAIFTKKDIDVIPEDEIKILSTEVIGEGEINLSVGGLTCVSRCDFELAKDTRVSIGITSSDGYSFAGWGGDCTGLDSCIITMSDIKSVTATFEKIIIEPISYTFSVEANGNGTLSLQDGKWTCEDNCAFSFDKDTEIHVNAIADNGYKFDSWGGDCSGIGSCVVTLSSKKSVSALFSSTACSSRAALVSTSFEHEYPYHSSAMVIDEVLSSFVVKNSTSNQVTDQAVSMVFPVEYGKYFNVGDFYILDSGGKIVPAQFNVLNRWWAKDRSLRHIQIHFNTDISAYATGDSATGVASFTLNSGIKNIEPENPVCITETQDEIQVSNGLTQIKIEKSPFRIITPAGELKSIFTTEAGIKEESFNHSNIKFEIEENGAQRTVVKASSLTDYVSDTEIKHGWAIRFYMTSNSEEVQFDFQLQNSAINTDYSGPLYYQSHELVLDNSGSTSVTELKAENMNGDMIITNLSGSLGSPNVNVYFRDFWQKFPQGLSTSVDGKMTVELYPEWSKQFLDRDFSDVDIYWLDDMRQSYQELLFDFSKDSITDGAKLTFQSPPVGVIPQEYYNQTSVTMELGGLMPLSDVPIETGRSTIYSSYGFDAEDMVWPFVYGHTNYGLDVRRKRATNMTGSLPYSYRQFWISGNPKDYYTAKTASDAELNVRPQWLSSYTHDADYSLIQPTANPYGGDTWRDFRGHGASTLKKPYMDGTSKVSHPRDDQHAWFYHMEQAYLMTGSKWSKDWFVWMAEYKKAYLQKLDPWPDMSNRSQGHNVSIGVSAYRITGNAGLGAILSSYVDNEVVPYLLAPHNITTGYLDSSDPAAATFQQGFLMKSLIDIYYEFPNQEKAVEVIGHSVYWNLIYARYSYYKSVTNYIVSSGGDGTGQVFVDVAAWYSYHTKEHIYAEDAIEYVTNGIGGGKPYGSWGDWTGGYQSHLYNYYLQSLD